MAGFSKTERQRIVDSYLNDTGRNAFVPLQFIEWLRDRPDHEVYDVFFGMDDAEAALAHRIELARGWVSGLRITVKTAAAAPSRIGSVTVREHRFPAMISPVCGRKSGGGYVALDPDDLDHMRELARQGAADLTRWIERYEGVASRFGLSVDALNEIAAALSRAGSVDEAA